MDNSSHWVTSDRSVRLQFTLYCTAGRPKLQRASVACSSATSSGAGKLERIQRQFVSLCRHPFPSHQDYGYGNVLTCWQLHALSVRRPHLDVLFLTGVFYGLIYYTTVLKKVGLHVPNRNCRDFSLFNVDCPSGRRASTANAIDGDNDLCSGQSDWLASDTCSA
jgi:hypothetical protein